MDQLRLEEAAQQMGDAAGFAGFESDSLIMQYNFDREIDRSGTNAAKWEVVKQGNRFVPVEQMPPDPEGRRLLPMWVADMDFPVPAASNRRAGCARPARHLRLRLARPSLPPGRGRLDGPPPRLGRRC